MSDLLLAASAAGLGLFASAGVRRLLALREALRLEGRLRRLAAVGTTRRGVFTRVPFGEALERLRARAGEEPGQAASLAAACLACALVGAAAAGAALGPVEGIIAAPLFGGIPLLRLQERARRRREALRREIPGLLEVLALCAEAGLTLEQGLEHYATSEGNHPLAAETRAVLRSLRAGSSRAEALAAASSRVRLAEFGLFVSTAVHAERAGTGTAEAFARLAESLREEEVQRTERAVQELPVKMLLPLLFGFFPVTFLVLFGPVLIQLAGF